MARSLASGLLHNGWSQDDIVVSDPDPEQRRTIESALGLKTFAANPDAAALAEILVLAVKPQILGTVATALAPTVQKKKPLVISIA
ncbi:MAG: NAD(P)-binding domain-containing protein, partial [Pseudomonadota bacterium]